MAAKLQCEICGGKLVGKPGGVFECESCGTEYSTEWAKAKIQEIKGTVKVEGTVDVKGSVQVEGPVKVEGAANAQSLIKRGSLALEDGKWDDAKKYFDDALNAEPENAEAYLGLVMASKNLRNKDAFASAYIDEQIEDYDKNLKRARQFADENLKKWFDEIDKRIKEVEEKRKAEEEKRKAEEERKSAENKKRLSPVRERISKYHGLFSAGHKHTVGLKVDGTVVAVGDNWAGKCDIEEWNDIVAVSAGREHTVGLKADGTVVTVGDDYAGKCDVKGWTDIVAVSAGYYHTVGLKSNGTVVATKYTGDQRVYSGQCDVEGWTDIVAVSAEEGRTVGLKADGTVVAVGNCDVKDWTDDFVAVSAGRWHIVGLKADGTVVAEGVNVNGQCGVKDWTDIVAVSAGCYHTVGLKADGMVVAVGDNDGGQCDVEDWTDIVAVTVGYNYTVGLKSDGTVVAVGSNLRGQCNVASWKLFKSEKEKEKDYSEAINLQNSAKEAELERAYHLFASLKDYQDSKERANTCKHAYEAKRAIRERTERITSLNSEKTTLQTELANLKGLFTGKRRKEIEARLSQIETELKSL